jgi:hypothetical protein
VDEEVDEGAGGSAWPRTAGVGFPNGIRDKANDSEERKTADVKMKRKKKERKVYTDCRDIVGSHAKRSKWKKKKTESTSTSREGPGGEDGRVEPRERKVKGVGEKDAAGRSRTAPVSQRWGVAAG